MHSAIDQSLHPYTRRVLVVAVIILCALQGRADSGEPEARGHPLSYWLEHYMAGIGKADERQTAEAAIREIGTNGLPAMLVWLWYEPSQTKAEAVEFLSRMRSSAHGRWVPPEPAHEHGVPPGYVGFNVLGPAAAPAIPDLEQIANDAKHPGPATRAMMALSAIGPAALPAVEARLANTNFPFPPEAALNFYIQTRTSTNHSRLSAADIRSVLIGLQTNANPLLASAATQSLQRMDHPTHIHPRDRLSPEEQRAASNIVHSALTAPPARPNGDEPYPYPLQPGTAAWNLADPFDRVLLVQIPKSWQEHATSWQLFRSTVGNPYFSTICLPGGDIGAGYTGARSGTVSILQEVDTAPEFGTNVLRWLREVDLEKMAASEGDKPYEPCRMNYIVVWYMATLDSALGTLDVTSRQRLYRLAVWDADYFLSRSETMTASGPVGLICALGKKPESFRGALPSGAVLSLPAPDKSSPHGVAEGFAPDLANLLTSVAAAKVALGLKERP